MTIETKTELPEGREQLELELGVTLKTGVQVPVEVILVYPEGNGLHAVKALEQTMRENINDLFQMLINTQDRATIDAMLASGHQMENEE